MTEVRSGIPDRKDVLSLLNEAYDGWGDEDYFAWKYDEYPGFDPQEHCFYIKDDELAAFRRVFHKELLVDDDRITTFVLGDTAVDPGHQGQGHYSNLHSETTDYCRTVNASATITFNNVDNVTFKANRKRGWKYSVLPLNLYIHSYDTVLKQYAELAIGGDSLLTSLGERIGTRIELDINSKRIVLSEIFGVEEKSNKRPLGISVEPRAVARLVETISNEGIVQTVATAGKQLIAGDISLIRNSTQSVSRGLYHEVEILDSNSVPTEDRESMRELYRVSRAGESMFRREKRDIDHLLKYPDAELLIVKERSDLVGFAVIGPYQNEDVLEARVLDLIAPSDEIYQRLIAKIEQYTAEQGFDLIVLLTKRNPGPEWAAIDRQVIMWDDINESNPPKLDRAFPPYVSMYDVL